jgi:hypothetical protein
VNHPVEELCCIVLYTKPFKHTVYSNHTRRSLPIHANAEISHDVPIQFFSTADHY